MSSEFSVRVVTCFLPVRQFITLHSLVWTLGSFDVIEMKATGQFLPVVLFIAVYYAAMKVVLTIEFVDNILKGDHSNESY